MPRHPSHLVPARTAADPFADLHHQMNRLFDDFLGGSVAPALPSAMALPRMDVRENPQEICISTDLPGVRPADVDVRIDGNMLTLRGEKHQESEPQQAHDYHLMERSWGRFQRSLQLPFAPQASEIQAEFEHGVLTVRIPKHAQQERSHRVEVHAKDPGATRAVTHAAAGGGTAPAAGTGHKPGGTTSHH